MFYGTLDTVAPFAISSFLRPGNTLPFSFPTSQSLLELEIEDIMFNRRPDLPMLMRVDRQMRKNPVPSKPR